MSTSFGPALVSLVAEVQKKRYNRDFFMFSGAEIRPHSQWNLGDFFPNFFFLKIGISFSQHTHKLHGDVLQFNGNSKVIANFFFY